MTKFLTLFASIALILPAKQALGADELRPFPQHTAYIKGSIKPTLKSQADLDQSVIEFYRIWKATYLRSTSEDQRYVFCNADKTFDPKDTRSVSEGHGFGMLAVVLMAGADPQAHADFDGLYRFFRAHPTQEHHDLMAWRQLAAGDNAPLREGPEDKDSATDGDLDIACALLMADQQWGSKGPINYRAEALKVITAILAAETDPERHTLTLGNWVDEESPQWGGIRPSDFMPASLKGFATASADPRWTQISESTYQLLGILVKQFSPKAGLVPDFIQYKGGAYRPAPAKYLEGHADGFYSYNACRVPWRVGTDYLLTGDQRALGLLLPLNAWIHECTGGDPGKINAGYRLDGKAMEEDDSAAFIGPFTVAAMVDSSRQEWLNGLWANLLARKPSAETYYGNTIKLLTMIVVSGNWWQPL